MILEIFVAIFVVIFTTMMATSGTEGYESDYKRMRRVEDAFEKLKKEGADRGPLKKMQKDGRAGEEHFESYGVNMDTSSGNTNVSSSDNKPVNKGPFEGGTLGNLFVEAAPSPITWNRTSGGKYEEPRDGADGADGTPGAQSPQGSAGGGGGKKDEGGYGPPTIIIDNSNFGREAFRDACRDVGNIGPGFAANLGAKNSHVDHIGETEETADYSTTAGGGKKDIDKVCDIYNANVKNENEKMTYETFSKEYEADLKNVLSTYGQKEAGKYLGREVNEKGSGEGFLKELDDPSKFKKGYKDSLKA